MIHRVAHFAAWTLNNPWTLGPMCMALVFVPVLGMWAVHKYGWEHWAPFDRGHKQGYTQCITGWRHPCSRLREKKESESNPRERGMGTPLGPSVLFCRISLTHYLRGVAQRQRGAFGKRRSEVRSLSPRLLIHKARCIFILWNTGRRTGKLSWTEWRMGRQQVQRTRTEIEQ